MIFITGETVKKYLSEFAGTFGFVFIGCGAVVFAAPFIGYLGISMAFGLAYGAMCFAFPDNHFNPAVTVSLALSKRFSGKNIGFTLLKTFAYILLQIAGACAAVALIYHIYSGKTGYVYQGSPDANIVERYTLCSVFWLESVLNFLFLCVFLGTDKRKEQRPLACAAVLTGAVLLSYPVTHGALNPARTTASALFSGETAVAQLPVFWTSAMTAAVIAGILYFPFIKKNKAS